MALKIKNTKMIDVSEWDNLVEETYGKIYSFQQQDGCKGRGVEHFSIPVDYLEDEDFNDKIMEKVNGPEMGVKFDVWLARDVKEPLKDENEKDGTSEWMIGLFWERNFYPDFYTIANDLHKRGLLEEGDYAIDIDW